MDTDTGRWEYKFRVRAVNPEGESEPLETEQGIIAKNPYDEPGKPGKPTAKDWDKHHVDLAWQPPTNDGGAPGMEYQFRVRAVNKAGPGAPSDASDMVIAKPRFLAPKIDRSTLKDVTIHAGQGVKFDVKVIGEPPPKTTWFLEKTELKDGGPYSIDKEPYRTKFTIHNAERKDTGEYKLVAENTSGKDEATVKITVLDKPTPPEGPLEVTDVHAEGCKLKWNPPKDDGGQPLDGYVVEKMDTDTGRWVPIGRPTKPEMESPEPLETEKGTIAKNPYDAPGKPTGAEVTDWDKDHMDLKWQPPLKDGGAPIEKYIVEKKEKDSPVWTKAAVVDGKTCEARVPDLIPGETYEFRVRAVNAAGPGEPSDTTKPMVAKPRKLAPKIDRRSLKPITIKVGQDFEFDVKVQGEPPPSISWMLGSKPVAERPTLSITNVPYNTKLTCDRAERKDNGVYKIIASNQYGTDEAEVEVNVISKPSKPEGPLEVSDVTKNGCKLAWNKPKDDGGEPITKYVVEKQDPDTGAWVPIGASHLPEFQVTGLTPGKDYKFRVKAVNKEGESEPLETDIPITAKDPYDAPSAPGKPEATDWNKDHVDLKWTPPDKDGGAPISHYVIEKKEKNSPRWEKAAEVPGDQCKGTAPFLDEGKEYEFRVIAVNKAGPGEPSEASKPVVAKPRFLAPRIDRKNLHDLTIKAGQPIKFDVNVQGEPPPTIVWSLDDETLKPTTHRNIETEDYNTKFSGKDAATVTVNVLDVPGNPEGPLEVSDVHKEGCKLKWKRPKDTGGMPLDGYLVEKMDPETGVWVPVGKTKEPGMDVTGLTPGKEYKFRVKALNKEGESEPLEMDGTIVAKNPFDEPGKPGNVEATGLGQGPRGPQVDSARERRWRSGGETKATVGDLAANQPYEFRVIAVNKAGPGEPSDATLPIITKPRKLAPKIDRTNLDKVRIKAGQNFNFDVNVIGEPPPEVTWTLKGQEDKPTPPGGPLKIEDVHAEGCTLKWNPPVDDGGMPVDHYVVEKLDPNTGLWVPAGDTIGPETQMKVKGLQPGKTYKFRVKAANRQGESEPLEADKSIVAKNPFDEPGSPGKPEIEDYDKDFVKLKWTPPENDGGSPITGYVIEKKDKYNPDWTPVMEVPADETKAKVGDLIEGTPYEFRVRAVNKGGPGVPSESTGQHVARPKNMAPRIDRTALHDIRIKVGKSFEFEVPVLGEPPPNKKWALEGKSIEDDKRWTISHEPYKTKLAVRNAERGDSGTLTLTATNPNGTDTAKVNVVVMDVPQAPQLIKIDKITKDNCEVSWKPPKDDGGCDILHYVVEKKDLDSGIWTPVAETMGTTVKAERLANQHQYHFRVKAVNKEGDSPYATTKDAITAKNPFDQPNKPAPPEVTDWDADHVDLEWRAPRDGGAPITGYVVEKRNKGSPLWEEAARVPGDATKATVPHLKEGEEYEFRIIALNKAGPSEPSDPSKSVVAKPRKLAPSLDKAALKDIKVRAGRPINFTVPIKGEPAPTVQWQIHDKPVHDNRVEVTNTASQTLLDIASSVRSDSGKYTLVLENDHGKTSASANVTVLDRPSAPQGPLGIAEVTKNSATITWKAPADDGGTPIKHYLIEKMDTSRGTWVEAGTTPNLTFKVPKLVHKKSYQFRVKAVNEIGESEPLEKTEPIIAKDQFEKSSQPGRPKVTDWDKDHVDLEWKPPTDDGGCPIKSYIIQKKERGSPLWTKAKEVPASQTKATVPDLRENQDYEFRVIAVNAGGESEPSEPSDLITCKPRFLAPKIVSPMKEVKVKIGQTLNVEIKFIGAPPTDRLVDG
ncbi:hypothetical protein MRX96_017667 [Rhipicephalus microplus]